MSMKDNNMLIKQKGRSKSVDEKSVNNGNNKSFTDLIKSWWN